MTAIEEQFSRLDAATRAITRSERRLSRLAPAILVAAFSRLPDVVQLDQIAEVRLGRQRSPKNHEGPNMRPYLRAANVTWRGLMLEDVKAMHFSEDEARVYELRPGDVILAEASGSAGEVGKPAVWRGEIDGCCFQNTLIRVRSEEAMPDYLRLFFLREALTGRFAQAAPGVGIHHLGASRLARWPVPWCDTGDQRKLIEAVEMELSVVTSMRMAASRARSRSDALRRSILDQAFRGRLVRQDQSDEPASRLLERIATARAAEPKTSRRRNRILA